MQVRQDAFITMNIVCELMKSKDICVRIKIYCGSYYVLIDRSLSLVCGLHNPSI